jgi:hypothetical protein
MSIPGIDVIDKAKLTEYLAARYRHANTLRTQSKALATTGAALGEMMAIADLCHEFDLVASVEDFLK